MDADILIRKMETMCEQSGSRLLYATYFGSTLYGTAVPGKSDIDIKGVFLPAKADALLGKAARHLHFTTGDDRSRNTADDADIELWSLPYWLMNLLPSGDTGALDLLYSFTNEPCVIHSDPLMEGIFSDPIRFVNLKGQRGYAGYAMSQAKKYGIKGSRLGVVKRVKEWLDTHDWEDTERLAVHFDAVLRACEDDSYCREIECNNERGMSICGKAHLASTPMYDFAKRIRRQYDTYGERAEQAMLGNGVDWKALSHAVRALVQMQELAATGGIIFPLKDASMLMEIKKGELSWPEVEKIILSELEKTDKACLDSPIGTKYCREDAERIILDAYGECPQPGDSPAM